MPETPLADIPNQASPESPGKKINVLPAVLIAGALALPFGYLALHYSHSAANPVATTSSPNADAITALEETVRVQPTANNRINLSLAYINAGRVSSAIQLLQVLVTEDPRNAKAWNNLCVAHNMKEEYKQSIEECERAVGIDPSFQLAQNNLHWAETQKQKALDAIADAEKAPSSSRTTESLLAEGLNCLHVGDYDQALSMFELAAIHEPQSAPIANDIGVAYMNKHQPSDAISWFTKASSLDPTLEIAKNNIAWAQSEQASTTGK